MSFNFNEYLHTSILESLMSQSLMWMTQGLLNCYKKGK